MLSLIPEYTRTLTNRELDEIIKQTADDLSAMMRLGVAKSSYEDEIEHTRLTMRRALYEKHRRQVDGRCNKCGGC